MNRITITGLLTVGMLLATPLAAQENLVANPGFDDDVAEWDNLFTRPNSWASEDFANSPDSGSAFVAHDGVGNNATPIVLSQCLPADASTEYRFGFAASMLLGTPAGATAQAFANVYSSTDCSGSATSLHGATAGAENEWQTASATFVTAADTDSIRIGFGVLKPTGVDTTAWAWVDNVFLHRTAEGGYRFIDENVAGTWYDPANSGQGFVLDITTTINLVFGGWYTWTNTAGDHHWYTVQGGFTGDLAAVTIYESSGGRFLLPTPVVTGPVGTGELQFTDCTHGEFRFRFTGAGSDTVIPLRKLGGAAKNCDD